MNLMKTKLISSSFMENKKLTSWNSLITITGPQSAQLHHVDAESKYMSFRHDPKHVTFHVNCNTFPGCSLMTVFPFKKHMLNTHQFASLLLVTCSVTAARVQHNASLFGCYESCVFSGMHDVQHAL